MNEAATAGTMDDMTEATITDVWSRTASKYRVRAVVLLIVNLLLFAGLGCFAYWLRTGQAFAPAMDGYWQLMTETFMPRGDATLANYVQFPINLEAVPTHGVVVGLLMAALVSIPILIAMLYRLPCALPFIAVVGFLAVMPWLAINLAAACVLATIRPLRFRFRYASALLGLLFVLLYFYGASRQTAPVVDMTKPEDRIKFMAPWILATLASCVIMGGVLFLAKLVKYRPGVVAPLLIISFAAPVIVFETYVGRDELRYRLLERDFRDRFGVKEHQVDHDVKEWFERIARQRWEAEPEPRPPFEVVRDLVEFRMALELDASSNQRSVFARQKYALADACDHFVRYFPDSRYAPNVLYLKAQALDMRIDLSAFRANKVIRYYDDFPNPRSTFEWRRVVANARTSSVSAVARYRLAVLEARAGRFEKAQELLDELIDIYRAAPNGSASVTGPRDEMEAGAVKKVLSAQPAEDSLKISVESTLAEARQFRALLDSNAADPRYQARPLCGAMPGEPTQPGLLQLDPRHPHYDANLAGIVRAYPRCLLADNIAVRRAMLPTDPREKADRLQACLKAFPNGDARPEALFRLGLILLELGDTSQGRESLEQLVDEYPEDRLWTPLAQDRLRALAARTDVKESTP